MSGFSHLARCFWDSSCWGLSRQAFPFPCWVVLHRMKVLPLINPFNYWETIALSSMYINDTIFHISLCFLLCHIKCLYGHCVAMGSSTCFSGHCAVSHTSLPLVFFIHVPHEGRWVGLCWPTRTVCISLEIWGRRSLGFKNWVSGAWHMQIFNVIRYWQTAPQTQVPQHALGLSFDHMLTHSGCSRLCSFY